MRLPLITALCGAALLVACATTPRTGDAAESQDVILRSELESRTFANPYQAIRELRTSWLTGRIAVYIDENPERRISVQSLHTMVVAQVERIELIRGEKAMSMLPVGYYDPYISKYILVTRRR